MAGHLHVGNLKLAHKGIESERNSWSCD
jgi:hypothetical protein